MKIRKARLADLEILLKMYESARMFMTSHGNPTQWGSTYPPKALILKYITVSGWMNPPMGLYTGLPQTAPSAELHPSA